MAVTRLSHYNLRAPRKLSDELRDFYCVVIGLSQGARPPFKSFGYWLYAGAHDVLHLTESRDEETRSTDVDTTFDHVAFACTDFQEMEAHLRKLSIAYERDDVPLTKQRQIFLSDPAGNGVELNFTEA